MKKLMFLTMIFGLMVVFSGSASAQHKARINNVDGNGKFKPSVGNKMGIGTRKQTDVAPPGFNLKPGDIACTLGINQTKGQSANAFFLIDCRKEPIAAATFKLTKVENPQNQDIIIGDGLDWNPNTLTITVSRGGKQTMILRFAR